MATQKQIKGAKGNVNTTQKHNYDFSVMKPFVKFGFGALRLLAHTLIFIVKGAIKLRPHEQESKPNKNVIKI